MDKNKFSLHIIVLFLSLACFFVTHLPIYLENWFRTHVDYTASVHYPIVNFIETVLYDRSLTFWQPYANFGSSQIYEWITLNPVSAMFAFVIYSTVKFFTNEPINFFWITHLSFTLTFMAIFSSGMYFLAKSLLKKELSCHIVLFFSICGPHWYGSVWVGYYSLMYVPYFLFFYLKILSGNRRFFVPYLSGLCFSFALCISSNLIYVHSFTNLIFILILVTLPFIFKRVHLIRRKDLKYYFSRHRSFSAIFAFSLFSLAVTVISRHHFKSLLGQMSMRRRELDMTTDAFLNKISSSHYYSFDIIGILRQTFDRYSQWIQNDIRYPYSASIGLFAILMISVCGFRFRRVFGSVLIILVFLSTLMGATPTSMNIVLPLLSKINPFFTWGTRFIGFNLVYAIPFLYLLIGLSFDNWIMRPTKNAQYRIINPILLALTIILIAFQLGWSDKFIIAMVGTCILVCISWIANMRGYIRSSILIILLGIVGERIIDLRTYFNLTYFPVSNYDTVPWSNFKSQKGISFFPPPFASHFSNWNNFNQQPLIKKKSEVHNSYVSRAFKVFSSEIWDYEWSHSLPDSRSKINQIPRMYFSSDIHWCSNSKDCLKKTRELFNQKDSNFSTVVVADDIRGYLLDHGVKQSSNLSIKNYKPKYETIVLKKQDAIAERPNKLVFQLPDSYPKYLTTNLLNSDYQDISLNTSSIKYQPTYFDWIPTAPSFQIGWSKNAELEIYSKQDFDPNFSFTLHYRDRLGDQGIRIKYFDRDHLFLTTNRHEAQILVYHDRFHPDWKAFIDMQEIPIFTVNSEFKGIAIPPGTHKIEFYFTSSKIKILIILSNIIVFISSFLVVALAYFFRKRIYIGKYKQI